MYCNHAAELGFTAVVRTPDSDVLFILLYHAQNIKLTVYIDIGTGKARQLLNATLNTVTPYLGTMCSVVKIAPVHSRESAKLDP